jgi:di/tricarboxylate transporter
MYSFPLYIQQWIVLLTTLLVVLFLIKDKYKPSLIFGAAVLLFLLAGIIQTSDFVESFSNESIITIFLLIFITSGIKTSFNLVGWLNSLFGKSSNGKLFMLKMTTAVAAVSSVINNTPLVAFMVPYVYQWSKKHQVPPSKLMIPISFAAIIGGMITVIGTSKNLILNGFIIAKNDQGFSFEDFFYLGILVTIAGILFMYIVGYGLLPSRTDIIDKITKQSREYLVETKINSFSKLAGKTIADAQLRNLEGMYLFEVVRDGNIISPVSPKEVLCKGDNLIFAGETENIVDLLKSGNGLELKIGNGNGSMHLIETVVPANSMLIGKTLKEKAFRENYDAAAVAIHRNGEKLRGKIGNVVIKAGDLLLVSAGESFEKIVHDNKDLYLVSVLAKTVDQPTWKKKLFITSLLLSLIAVLLGLISLFLSLLIITSSLLCLRMLSLTDIQKNLDFDLLLILASSLAFSKALIDSGTAQLIADNFIPIFKPGGSVGLLIGVFLLTLLLTSFVTHVATVSIVFPIVYALCHSSGLTPMPFYVAIAFAASASFHAPFSYQTNLMVYGPGGYKYKDFLKIGIPFTLVYSIICVIFIVYYYKV